jgi:hypothetical protein
VSTSINSIAARQDESGETWFNCFVYDRDLRSLSPLGREISLSEIKWLYSTQPDEPSYYSDDLVSTFLSETNSENINITIVELEALERYHFNKAVENSIEKV